MRFYLFLLILTAITTTSCFKGGHSPVTREEDEVRTDLLAELKQMELDGYIINNQIKIARGRIEELSIHPKMADIAKKDLYQKEKFYSQIEQQIAYLKIRLNNREKYFLQNQSTLTKEHLAEEYAQYSQNKTANPGKYPWRIPSMQKAAPPTDKEKSSHH